MQIVAFMKVRRNAQFDGARTDVSDRRLRRFLHHVAKFPGQSDPARSFDQRGLDLHNVSTSFGHGQAVRQPDLCFRWGGDEFAVILTGNGAGDAAPLGARLKGEVYSRCRRPDGEPMEVTFAVAELGESMPASELGEMAGMALTSAKAQDKSSLEDFEDRL